MANKSKSNGVKKEKIKINWIRVGALGLAILMLLSVIASIIIYMV